MKGWRREKVCACQVSQTIEDDKGFAVSRPLPPSPSAFPLPPSPLPSRHIAEHYPKAAERTICEIIQNDSLEFMVPEAIDNDINTTPPPNLTRMFAEGRVSSAAMYKDARVCGCVGMAG